MFKIFLILIFLTSVLTTEVLSQELLFGEEITLEVEGFTPQTTTTVTYTLEAYSAVYANSSITSNYLIANEEVPGNGVVGVHYGWRIFSEPAPFEPIANGLYKLYTNYGENYVYIDLRDCQWANSSYPVQYPTDFYLKYNAATDKFYYKEHLAPSYSEIPSKNIVGIWTIKVGERVTSCFNQYVPNSLALYAPQTKAKLFWEPLPPEEMLPTKYRIWYAWELDEDPAQPEPGDYYWIADVNSSILDFTDLSNIDKNNNNDALFASYYYIQALNGTQSLYTSNIVKNLSVTDWTKTLKITNDNNRPRIVWVPFGYAGSGNYGYKIYRKVETIPPSRPPAQYQLIYTTNTIYENILSYTDYNFTIGGNSLVASYYVVPVEGSFTGPASNIVSSNVLLYKNATSDFPKEYFIDQNYPNPFNPSTQITYNLKNAGLVKLKVYNILGSEVAELVNETKEEDYHSVEFNASNLPSGVYIYTLHVNGYSESKKMLLLK